MAKFKIQGYNKDMTSLEWEDNKEFDRTEEALICGYDMASSYDIVIVYRQSIMDSKCWVKIAKFY
jgi:hypothetical protein